MFYEINKNPFSCLQAAFHSHFSYHSIGIINNSRPKNTIKLFI